jgi:hypothetical protein
MTTITEDLARPLLQCSGFQFHQWIIPSFVVQTGMLVSITISGDLRIRGQELLLLLGGQLPHPAIEVDPQAEIVKSPVRGLFRRDLSFFDLWWLGNPSIKAWLGREMELSSTATDTVIAELSQFERRVVAARRFDVTPYFVTHLWALAVALSRSPLVLYSTRNLDPLIKKTTRRYARSKVARRGIIELTAANREAAISGSESSLVSVDII